MIPKFPDFKKLELSDYKTVRSITDKFPPYSDYNFVSLYSWDVHNGAQISDLQGNLILKYQDYITGETFFSYLGKNKHAETALALIKEAKRIGICRTLKLMTKESIEQIENDLRFHITEDRDNFDYILSVDELSTLKGKKHSTKRNMIKQFEKLHFDKSKISILDFHDIKTREDVLELFFIWEKVRKKERKDTENELAAIYRLFDGIRIFDIHILALYIDNRIAGISIEEMLPSKFAMIHFEKTDLRYKGISEYLKKQSVLYLAKHGCIHINYEQDLGIEGLRIAKMIHRPVDFLKKYSVSLKN